MKNPKTLAESTTPSQLMRRLQSRIQAMTDLLEGLKGKPFAWGSGEAESYRVYIEKECGLTLVTRTSAAVKGYKVKRSASPVGSIYFNAPIAKRRDMFVLQVQCEKAGEQ